MARNRRNPSAWLALAALLAAGPVALFVPRGGTLLLLLSLAGGAHGSYRAWTAPGTGWRGRWLAPSCLALSCLSLLRLAVAPLGLPSTESSLRVNGSTRSFRLYRPAGPAAGEPVPVVIAFHGLLQRGYSMERLSGFDRLADESGFLAVYPQGFRRSWNDTDTFKPATRAGVDDVGFVRALIERLVRDRHADPARIYAVGFSNGGFLALRLACELSERIAAVAVVGAGVTETFPPDCAPARPVPAMFVLGQADPLVPWSTFGKSAERWSGRIGCARPAEERTLPDAAEDGTRVLESRYAACPEDAEVVQWTVRGGGHTWPGGPQYLPRLLVGPTSRDVDASREIWSFLRRHTLDGGR